MKNINNACNLTINTFKKLRFNYGLTHSFPFIHNWTNNDDNSEQMIAEYDKFLRSLYTEPYYKLMSRTYPTLSIPKSIIDVIYEYQYGERAYRVFKHYLVHKLKSQHDSTIYIIPFILGYIESICITFICISIFSNNININICNSIQFKIYIICNLCHFIGICLSYINGIQLSKKLKIMNQELLFYIYGGNDNKNKLKTQTNGLIDCINELDIDAENDMDEPDVIFNFKRNYSNHSNCSNVSNCSGSSTQSTFSALHRAFGLNDDLDNNIFGHYTSFFIEDYMSKMRMKLTHIYDISAFDGFQRWCNVFEMEISDQFINNFSIIFLLLCKYIIPLIFGLLCYFNAINVFQIEVACILLIFISCIIIAMVTYCCSVSLFHLNKLTALKRSIWLAIISLIGHVCIVFGLWWLSHHENTNSKDSFTQEYRYNVRGLTYLLINGHWFTDYILPTCLFISCIVLMYKYIYFAVINHVILNKKCNNLSQSLNIYRVWSYLMCVLFFVICLLILPSWIRCKYCTIISLILFWILCIVIYIWIQLTCHQALTNMTPQMYLFNYVQYSRKWICQPILFLLLGQIIYLFPIFGSE